MSSSSLRTSFSEADKGKIDMSYRILMDRGAGYIEEIHCTDISREDILERLKEMFDLLEEISSESAKAFRLSHVLTDEQRNNIRGLFGQVRTIMDEHDITKPEVDKVELFYTDLRGRKTAMPMFGQQRP